MVDRKKLEELVKRFDQDFKNKRIFDDPEVDTERLFIEPFLETLGWDIRTREVRKNRKAGFSHKRTDYSFWDGRNPLFILEAKSSSVSLDGYYVEDGNKVPFPQKTLQYAWNTNVPVGVLFNFKEIRIYNATARVRKPEEALLLKPIYYSEFIDRIDEIALLSKKSLMSGILYNIVRNQNIEQDLPIRKSIDKTILDEIIKWRKILLSDIAERYKHSIREMKNLKEIVQLFLDRIIFIRVIEDLNLERSDGLWSIVTNTEKPYMKELIKLFEYIDQYYNSMLFCKSLLDNIEISDDVITSIIKNTYDYRFDSLPIDLFGSFYENYIGYVLNDEKEIVKDSSFIKSKGIYYTPPQIVDLISSLTLKEKLNSIKKSSGRLKIPDVKVLDPACGSGSFIMRAYDEITTYMDEKYEESEIRKNFDIKKNIISSCIYGVDLDNQAVEIASTYLLIGLLKDSFEKPLFLPVYLREKNKKQYYDNDDDLPLFKDYYEKQRKDQYETLQKMVKEGSFHLPTMMGDNATVRCGNSLISGPVKQLKNYFGNRLKEIKPFNWMSEFPEIFIDDKKYTGFDVIIGNPPYRNMDEPKEGEDPEIFERQKVFLQNFKSTDNQYLSWNKYYRRMSDIYYFFFFRGITLLKEDGLLSYITSRSYIEAYYSDLLRRYILDTCVIKIVIDFGDVQVFEKPNITNSIIVLQKSSNSKKRLENVIKIVKVKSDLKGYNFNDRITLITSHILEHIKKDKYSDDYLDIFRKSQKDLTSDPWIFVVQNEEDIYSKIDRDHPKLKDICIIGEGMQTGCNKVFCEHTEEDIIVNDYEKSFIWKRSVNSDIKPYYIEHGGKYAIFIENIVGGNDDLTKVPRNIREWLIQNKEKLQKRAAYLRGDCLWWKYTFPLHMKYINCPKIITPYRSSENKFYLDDNQEYLCFTDTTVIFIEEEFGFGEELDLFYILGLLNSRLLTFRYKGIGKLTGNGMREYFVSQVGKLPIKIPDKNNEKEMTLYKMIKESAKEIQLLYKQALSMPETFEKRRLILEESIRLKSDIDKYVEDIYGVSI